MTDKPFDQAVEVIYTFICVYIGEHGYSPSLREIGAHCYMGRSTVIRYLDRLEAQGRISRDLGKARSISLLDREEGHSPNSGQMVGQVSTPNKNGCANLKGKKEQTHPNDT